MNFIQAVAAARRIPSAPSGIVTSGLIWHIDPTDSASYPGSGSTIYDLVGSNNGAFEGGVYVDASGHLRLDGVNDAVSFGSIGTSNPLSFQSTSFSINVWFYANNSGETYQHMLSQWANDGRRLQWFIYPTNREMRTRIDHTSTSDNTVLISANQAYNAFTWYYYTSVIDIANFTIEHYLNGVSLGSVTLIGSIPATIREMRIGSRGNDLGRNEFNGRLGAYHVYNKALSATEIFQNYNATKGDYGL